ncbi:family 78 glycoside hydrolase catalytic domain [Streptomyces sp. JV185]|uniref:family 78 glycoside hydrolase catalytic domain n=1 Tax=Streptomyces sp. JV185 TaxID=858638 RepID=UPI002E75B929|nr:family 78 glycoside hydrolase catalytic domain [Streptomyces sp. JV185]MEE1774008.1 family 78 glycoside hydrolase catalytic domain [Streptomyces sp. JV185]
MSGSPTAGAPARHRAEGRTAGRSGVRRLRPYALRCEHRATPLGIDEPAPRLSWRLASDLRGDDPVAHRVRVARRVEDLYDDGQLLWDTGRVTGTGATAVDYAGPALLGLTRFHWRVSVWPAGSDAPAEADSWFETGFTRADQWRAAWIAQGPCPVGVMDAPTEGEFALDDHGLAPCPLLRRSFTVPAGARGRVHVSARGLYELRLNGERVGDAELAPGWTDYRHRVQYQTYDVSALLREGENVLAATVADGWWSGFVGFEPRRAGAHYGSSPQFLAELHLTGPDDRSSVIATDETWRTGTGAIRHADLLMGECHDLRCAADGWELPGFDDSGWSPALVTETDHRLLVASADEPVRAMAELRPCSVERVSSGTHVVDFGQNLAGRVRLTVRGLAAGARVVIRHAEVLDGSRRLYTANLRTAAATDVLVGDGREHFVFEPRFTYHGFRYAEISGMPELTESDVVAVALHSDTPWAGEFDCSDAELRRLHDCVAWGQRSNFVSVPTDCPQRDERLGWLADAQVFLPTAALNADVAAFFTKWLRDVDDARTPDGGFTNVAPRLVGVADEGAPGWADAGVIIPWHLYRVYDDPRFLARSLAGMCAWVDLIRRHNPGLVWRHRVGPHFSDWLAPGTPTPRDVVATAYFAHSARLTAQAAEALGQKDVGERHHRLADDIRRTFNEHFVTVEEAVEGLRVRVAGDTQTGYLLALAFELLPAELAGAAARRLAELVESAGPALVTGFLGVALAAPVLDAHGRADLAHALLLRDEVPSWRFPLRHGATTIWERWDGWTPDAGFRAPSMNSFNHYALGSVGEWLYRGVAGLDQAPDSTGYRTLRIRPRPGGLRHASARYESVRGAVSVTWERQGGRIALRVLVPPGATAEVYVPTTDPGSVRESGLVPDAGDRHITAVSTAADHVLYRVSSGAYRFTAAHPPVGDPPAADRPRPSLTPSRRTSGPAAKPSFARSYEEDTP